MIHVIRRTVRGKEQFYTGHCTRSPHENTVPAWGDSPFEARSWKKRQDAENWKRDLNLPGRVIENHRRTSRHVCPGGKAMTPQDELTVSAALRRLIADDAYAITFQTFGQYRTALLRAIDAAWEAQRQPAPADGVPAAPAPSHDYPACAIFRGGKCTCDEANNDA